MTKKSTILITALLITTAISTFTPSAKSASASDIEFTNNLKGKILLQVELLGKASKWQLLRRL